MAQSLKFKKYFSFLTMNLIFLTLAAPAHAAWSTKNSKIATPASSAWTLRNGKLINAEEVDTLSVSEHYELGMKAMENCNWKEAADNFRIVAKCFPLSTYAQDANYYLGISLFELKEYDFANEAFSSYIGAKNHPKFFIEAIEYKFCIAEAFRNGACRRFFNKKQMPKWASGVDLGLSIYDEVIAALPSHEFAVRSLYSKACLLSQGKRYRESIDALQLIVKRFPKHELAPESYLMITKIHLDQARAEFQNPDLLAFSEINLRRFKAQFPREERLAEAEKLCHEIKEVYAQGLYDTGLFYERIKESKASIIYYQNAINQFPETAIAKLCESRLLALKGE